MKRTNIEEEESVLPIRKVVLYKHGVAYFERRGTVEDNQQVDIFFKSEEMNDVLKSLTVLDLNKGDIASISYDANQSFVFPSTMLTKKQCL